MLKHSAVVKGCNFVFCSITWMLFGRDIFPYTPFSYTSKGAVCFIIKPFIILIHKYPYSFAIPIGGERVTWRCLNG